MSATFDPLRILEVLHRHGVKFVLVGGLAAVAHGSTLATVDVDIVPERSAANFDGLAAALRELDARPRSDKEPDGVVFPVDGEFLAAQPRMLNLVTSAGDLDLAVAPAGFGEGYAALRPAAVLLDIVPAAPTPVAALDDLIASKRAAGRAKDVAALPYLEALRDEISRHDSP